MSDKGPEGPYDSGWIDLKFRKRLFWGLFLGWLPFGLLMALLGLSNYWAPFVFIPYMVISAGASLYTSFFPCPRCERYFFMRGPVWFLSYHNAFTKTCLNCGLPAYAKFNPGEDQQRAFENRQPIPVKIFGFLILPLVAANIVVGILLVTKVSGKVISRDEFVWQIFGFVQAASLILSLLTITAIRKPGLKSLMNKVIPLWAKLLFGMCFAGSILIGLYSMITAPRLSNEPFSNPVPDGIIGAVVGLLGMTMGLLALYYTREVCRRLYLLKCPNGHETPEDAVRCPICGSLLP